MLFSGNSGFDLVLDWGKYVIQYSSKKTAAGSSFIAGRDNAVLTVCQQYIHWYFHYREVTERKDNFMYGALDDRCSRFRGCPVWQCNPLQVCIGGSPCKLVRTDRVSIY